MNSKNLHNWLFISAMLLLTIPCSLSAKSEPQSLSEKQPTVAPNGIKTVGSSVPFPKNVQILLPVQYRKESTGYPQNVKEKEWYELYKNTETGQWTVGKAELKISYGRDECVDEAIMVIKSKHKDAILFFTPFEGLSTNVTTILEDKPLIPNQPVSFEMNGKTYTLLPKGKIWNDEGKEIKNNELQKDSEGKIYIDELKPFSLSFSSGQAKAYTIETTAEINSVVPKVVWLGDMNNDGLPDMILNLSDFYESLHLFLYLSDPGDKEQPLKKLADLNITNDC